MFNEKISFNNYRKKLILTKMNEIKISSQKGVFSCDSGPRYQLIS